MTSLPAARGPRFVFVTDSRSGVGGGRVGWQLDAANNRPLGRGVGTHPSVDDCRRRLDALRSDPGRLVDVMTFDSARGLWSWQVNRGDNVCAAAMRTYLRRFECRRAVSQFKDALVSAAVNEGVLRVVRPAVLARYDAEPSGTAAAS